MKVRVRSGEREKREKGRGFKIKEIIIGEF